MTEKQSRLMEDLKEVLIDTAGDIIALETFLRCRADCEEQFGRQLSGEWLCRIHDYLKQHVRDMELLSRRLRENADI